MHKVESKVWHGVNLGNWLVLERWMKPSLFAGSNADDVYGLERDVPAHVLASRLQEHYDTYVTKRTFERLAFMGCDLVRLPLPYWVFGSAHHGPVVSYVDAAMDWAQSCGLSVLLDLHTVPGSQNGFDNGGVCGLVTWHLRPERVDFAVGVVRELARRYAGHPALFGIEPLNEPVNEAQFKGVVSRYGKRFPDRVAASSPCPRVVLRRYYERCYQAVRESCGDGVAVVLHDRFELERWNRFMLPQKGYANVWMDAHLYLGFSDDSFDKRTVRPYVRHARRVFGRQVAKAARTHPVLVGEWSNANHVVGLAGAHDDEQLIAYRAISSAQMAAWARGNGGCFWSFRSDVAGRESWSLLACMERGWLSYPRPS